MTSEAIKSHLLFHLLRANRGVTIGELKNKMLGTNLSSDEVIDSLWKLGRISVDGNKVLLSEEGKYYMDSLVQDEDKRMKRLLFEDQYDLALLEFFYHRPHLVHMEDIPPLLKAKAPQEGNSVNDGRIRRSLIRLRPYLDNPHTNWYGINQDGKDYVEHQIAKFNRSQQHEFSLPGVNRKNTSTDTGFTESDKQDMNAKLDHLTEIITREFEKVRMSQEFTYNDIIEELNEMRRHYDLPKKTWRQLLAGKLTEMTLGGVISEVFSKRIADEINPIVGKLLE